MAVSIDELAAAIVPDEGVELPTEGEDEREPAYDFSDEFWLRYPYFADDFAEEVVERFGRHVDAWDQSGVGRTVWLAYRAYHNLGESGTDPLAQLAQTGEQGELLAMAIPHYRSLVRHQIALFTKERPAWDPQARTSDAEAARQVPLASNLLDYVASSGIVDRRLAEQCELMMVCGAGYYVAGWNPNAGLEGRGWFSEGVYAPWEMAHERVRVYDDATWWIYRTYESRWEWVAHYAESDPEKAEELARLDTKSESFAKLYTLADEARSNEEDDGDRIPVLNLIAKPTKACPSGRMAKITGERIVLLDGPSPYGETIPISRMCASEFLGTAIPYCDSWGVLAAAEAFNAILSMLITRVDTAGVPNFFVPEGSELEYSDLAGGNACWKLPPGAEKPGVVDLLTIPGELVNMLSLLSDQMEQTVGINSVTRGQPSENISSGSMAALLQSMAIEFNSNLERAWILNLERIGTHYLQIFQRMSDEDQSIAVMGADNRWTVKSMRGESLRSVARVSVKTASALSKTTAGRADIADKLLERGACTPQEYLRIIQTGQLEPTFHGPVGELNTIKARSEKLLRGEPAPALSWDNHQLCIREFRALLNSEARNEPQVVQVVQEAIQEHFTLWTQLSQQSPDILAAIGIPPLPQAMQIGQQAMMMGQQGMPPPGAPPEGPRMQPQPNTEEPGKPGPAPQPPGPEPTGAGPRMPRMPTAAKNPMTGQAVTG